MLNAFSEGLFATTLIAFAIFSLGSMGMWIFSKLTKRQLSKRSYIVPLAIILVLATVLGQKVLWDLQTFRENRDRIVERSLEDKWRATESFLTEAFSDNYKLSEQLAADVIHKLNGYDSKMLDQYLSTIATTPGNPIQLAVGDVLRGVYFRGIVSDANDPFAMIIGRGEEDSFIFADYSENCSVDALTRNLSQEYELQGRAGNRELAEVAFKRLVALHTGKPLEEAIFFQFNCKAGVPLTTLDYKGLRRSFFANKGSLEDTFKSIEFLAPYYIYRDQSIGGTPRIENRVKTDAKIIAIVSVFSFYDVINASASMSAALKGYDYTRRFLIQESLREERTSLLVGILIMLIAILLFTQFWVYSAMEDAKNTTDKSGANDARSSQESVRR